jgi:5,10-methylenetetrahydromethanopterin reductase
MAMASAIATIARLSDNRFRACFGTGYTARMVAGQAPWPVDRMIDYVAELRGLLAGDVVEVDGRPARMAHWPGLTADRPVEVPLWLSVLGPRGNARAPEVADGTIGPLHPALPTATMVSGTVLDPDEDRRSARVLEAIGPWRVVGWHTAYATRGAHGVDAKPGGRGWRDALESLAPDGGGHLLAFEGHVTHLAERDRPLLEHIDVDTMVGEAGTIAAAVSALGDAGFAEVLYTPSGPDVGRELRTFAAAVEGC